MSQADNKKLFLVKKYIVEIESLRSKGAWLEGGNPPKTGLRGVVSEESLECFIMKTFNDKPS